MNPFWIDCTTCHARLKVRDASAIGQIVACPKCGSMVLIVPPGGDKAPVTPFDDPLPDELPASEITPPPPVPPPPRTPRDAAPPVATKNAPGGKPVAPPNVASVEGSPANESVKPNASGKSNEPGKTGVVGKPVEPRKPAESGISIEPAKSPQPIQPVEPNLASEGKKTPEPRQSVETSDADEREQLITGAGERPTNVPDVAPSLQPTPAAWRNTLVMAAVGVTGGLVLAICFFLWLTSGGSTSTSDSTAVASAKPDQATGAPSQEETKVVPPGEAVAVADKAPETVGENPAAPPTPPANKANEKPEENKVPPSDPPMPNDQPQKKPVDAAAKEDPAGEEKSNKPERPEKPVKPSAEPEGPPELNPRLDLGGKSKTGASPLGGRFANLINGGAETETDNGGLDAIGERPGKPFAVNDVNAPPIAPEEEIIRPRIREIDINARLADPVSKLQLKDMPLDEFVRFLSDLSTIPISLDTDALRLRRLSPSTHVTVQVEQTTVDGVLNAALEPLQLGKVVTEHGVRVTHVILPASADRKRSYDVADLIGGDPQQGEVLRQWIVELIDPASWTDGGGAGTIALDKNSFLVQNRDEVHFKVLYFFDKLRVARKLTPKGKYPEAWLKPGELPSRGQAALQTVVKLNFNRSTRFTQILARLGQATKLRIVVDWDALLDAGWTPETMARLTVDGKPLSEALTMLLGPRDLVYRLVDDTTLEITTPVAAAQHVECEFYDVSEQLGKEKDPQPIIEQWQERIGIREFREQGGAGVIRFDPVSRCILLSQPYALNSPPP